MKKWLGVVTALVIAGVLIGIVIIPAMGQDGEDEMMIRTYDEDEDGVLSRQETLNAIVGFFNGQITLQQAIWAATLFQMGGDFDIVADYGDAPDNGSTNYPVPLFTGTGHFPSLLASNGARTLSTNEAILGLSASEEFDAKVINQDDDDAIGNFFINLTGIPPKGELFVNVTAPETISDDNFYLNVLIDLNMNGVWGGTASFGEPEWVVKNDLVNVIAGTTIMHHAPPFLYGNGNRLPDGAWMRIALTKEMINSADWDGSGVFSSGEIEDHVVTIPPMKILKIDCGGPYKVKFPMAPWPLKCRVDNLGALDATFDWNAIPLTPGFRIDLGALLGEVNIFVPSGGTVWIPTVPNQPPPLNPPFLVNDLGGGAMPCSWKVQLTPDPDCLITDQGVQLGLTESSAMIDFLEDVENPPTIAIAGETGSKTFSHLHYCGGGPCPLEEIDTFWITNAGSGTLEWEIQHPWAEGLWPNDGWLHIDPVSGTAPTEVTLSFDCSKAPGWGGFWNFPIHGWDPNSGLWATNSGSVYSSVQYEIEAL